MGKKRSRTKRTPDQIYQVRARTVRALGLEYPPTAKLLIDYFGRQMKERNLKHLSFAVNELPTSVNHQYKHTRFNTRLEPEVLQFRQWVCLALGHQRLEWKPTGTTAALLFFESPLWVTQKREVRQMDADNRVKPVLDAVERATNVPDELCWEVHCYKIASRRTRTTCYLFDMGDVVDFFVGTP